MGKPLKVLVVEDSADDAELMIAELMRGGFSPDARRVDTMPELQAALAQEPWDLVLSDCNMPSLSADLALTALQDSHQDLPFIVLSGVVRPEDAVALLKRGAHDFISKDAMGPRLVPAVERELREAADRAQRRAAEERVSILSLAVEQSPVSVAISGRDGIIQYVNPRFEQVSGYAFAEAVGRKLDFTRGDSDDAFEALLEAVRAGEEWQGELCSRRPDGEVVWERASVSPLRNQSGTVTHFVAVKEDITERRNRETDLRHTLDQLTQSNTELERFAYVASHDLQEPLRTVTLYCQLLDRNCRSQLDADADDYLQFIVGAAKRMHALINDLLAYSRVTDKGLPFAPVKARDACASAMQNLQESIREAGAVVDVGPLPVVVADQVQLMQLFQNLIGNAIKFHRPGIAPRIRVAAERVDDELVFLVADNGIGIEESQQDVFEIFRRLHTTQAYPGTGVGLAICKRIVQRHGGRIWMASRPGEGSTFYFTLGRHELAE